jgi:hypothetical protein
MTLLDHPTDQLACLPGHLVAIFVSITDRDYKYTDGWSNSLNLWIESIAGYSGGLRTGRQAGQPPSVHGKNRDDQVIAERYTPAIDR